MWKRALNLHAFPGVWVGCIYARALAFPVQLSLGNILHCRIGIAAYANHNPTTL